MIHHPRHRHPHRRRELKARPRASSTVCRARQMGVGRVSTRSSRVVRIVGPHPTPAVKHRAHPGITGWALCALGSSAQVWLRSSGMYQLSELLGYGAPHPGLSWRLAVGGPDRRDCGVRRQWNPLVPPRAGAGKVDQSAPYHAVPPGRSRNTLRLLMLGQCERPTSGTTRLHGRFPIRSVQRPDSRRSG